MPESREELRELLIDAADAETSIGRRMAGLVVDAQLAALAEAGVTVVKISDLDGVRLGFAAATAVAAGRIDKP